MDKKKVYELSKIVKHDGVIEESLKKKVKIINDNTQYKIRIPKRFSELLQVKDDDYFEFCLIQEKGSYKLEGKLLRE